MTGLELSKKEQHRPLIVWFTQIHRFDDESPGNAGGGIQKFQTGEQKAMRKNRREEEINENETG